MVLLIVPGLFLLTIWAVIVPAVVIDRTGVMGAFGRSRELVRGSGWQVFGVILVLFLLQAVVGGALQAIGDSVSDGSFAGYAVADLIGRVLIVPLSAIAATVMYVELRRIKGEALPEDLTGGAPPAPPDPTAPPASAPPASAPPASTTPPDTSQPPGPGAPAG